MTKNIPYSRPERIAERMHHLFSEALMAELDDPRLKNVYINRVMLTPDLSIARVYYSFSPFDKNKDIEIKKAFSSITGFLKKIITSNIVMKFVPKLEYFYDSGLDAEEHIENLLRSVNNAK